MSTTYRLSKDQRAFAFDPSIPPVLEIDSGDSVIFETGDFAYQRLFDGETLDTVGLNYINAVTGPVRVRGAQPGDALKIDILDIQVTSAWNMWVPQFGKLRHLTNSTQIRQVPMRDGYAYITDEIRVPLRPMIGCIGLAPAEGQALTFRPTYPFGGNMDLREMEVGTTLYLPVQTVGALLSVGDLHAAMGRSEPTSVSLESAGSATLRIAVEKGMTLPAPRLRIGSDTYLIGMGDSWQTGYQHALDQAYTLLTETWKLDPFVAYTYLSANADMRLGGPAGFLVMAVVPDIPAT